MTAVPYVLLGLLGLAVGSFLNVVVWRVPREESVVSPPSACPACGARIRARDNVPVLSWLVLRGRCRDCGARISVRYPLVEAATAVVFICTGLLVGWQADLPAFLYLASISVALVIIDLEVQRLPDKIVLPGYPVLAVLLTGAAWIDGSWDALVRALLGGAGLFVFYLALALIRPSAMGGGDVKLAGLLGAMLGWIGWGAFAVGVFGAFFFGGIFGLGVIVARHGDRKTGIPFGPWMVLGAVVGLVWGESLMRAYLDLVLV